MNETLNYAFEWWEFDFLVKHFLYNEDAEYDSVKDEFYALTERNGSTVVFHGNRDEHNAWLEVFSLNEGEELGKSYLQETTQRRVESVYEESREKLGVN